MHSNPQPRGLQYSTLTNIALNPPVHLYVVAADIWSRDPPPTWLSPIWHGHLMLIYVMSLLLMVASVGIFQEKQDDDDSSKSGFTENQSC